MSGILSLLLFLGWIYYIYKCVPLIVDTVNDGPKSNLGLLILAAIGAFVFAISGLIGIYFFVVDVKNGTVGKQ